MRITRGADGSKPAFPPHLSLECEGEDEAVGRGFPVGIWQEQRMLVPEQRGLTPLALHLNTLSCVFPTRSRTTRDSRTRRRRSPRKQTGQSLDPRQ